MNLYLYIAVFMALKIDTESKRDHLINCLETVWIVFIKTKEEVVMSFKRV